MIHAIAGAGCEVFRLRERIAPDSPDIAVISAAQDLDAILVSLNGDFADIVAYPPSRFNGILAIQLRNHPEALPPLLSRLRGYILDHSDMAHYCGKLFLVEPHRIRIRS